MIRFDDIQQQTPEWHEIKYRKIGGTRSANIIGKGDLNTVFIDLLSEFLEEYEPFDEDSSFESYDMLRGNNLEPDARQYLNEYYKINLQTTGWLQNKENKLLGISPDGITEDNKIACEIKCLSKKEHTRILYKQQIPEKYIPQCIHYFTVNPTLDTLFFIAYRPEAPKHFVKVLTRESEVNIGTEKTPIKISIAKATETARTNADTLLQMIEESVEQLTADF